MNDDELLELPAPEGTAEDRLADMQRLNEGYFLNALLQTDAQTAKEAIGLFHPSDFHSGLRSIYEAVEHLVHDDKPHDIPAVLAEVQSGDHAARNGQLLADLISVDADSLRLYEYGSALASAGFRSHLIASAEQDREDAISGDLSGLFERKQHRGMEVNAHRERLNAIRARAGQQPVGRMEPARRQSAALRVVGRQSRRSGARHSEQQPRAAGADGERFAALLADVDGDYVSPIGQAIGQQQARSAAADPQGASEPSARGNVHER